MVKKLLVENSNLQNVNSYFLLHKINPPEMEGFFISATFSLKDKNLG